MGFSKSPLFSVCRFFNMACWAILYVCIRRVYADGFFILQIAFEICARGLLEVTSLPLHFKQYTSADFILLETAPA